MQTTTTRETPTARPGARSTGDRRTARPGFFENAVRARFEDLEHGSLVLHQAGRSVRYGQDPADTDLTCEIEVEDPTFWRSLALRGSVGAGESFMRGQWTASHLPDVIRLFVRNRATLQAIDSGWSRLSAPFLSLYHAARKNTRAGARANIRAHYDLSNEFFALFLDETMTYSCGIFESPASTMAQASRAKIDRLCQKLELGPGIELLEIGTGWGALAIHAAREYGCRVTTTTISAEQHKWAQDRIREAGLEERIDLRLEDYRDLRGQYDRIVSVEMIEAIGHKQYPVFFGACSELLKPDGWMALQAITIADQHYEEARRSVDFIQRWIFPGCCIPSNAALADAMGRSSDLRLTGLEDIGLHYATTLAHWNDRMQSHSQELRALGFDEDFQRLWEFYFAYCEGGFRERLLSDVQWIAAKPMARPQPIRPFPVDPVTQPEGIRS